MGAKGSKAKAQGKSDQKNQPKGRATKIEYGRKSNMGNDRKSKNVSDDDMDLEKLKKMQAKVKEKKEREAKQKREYASAAACARPTASANELADKLKNFKSATGGACS